MPFRHLPPLGGIPPQLLFSELSDDRSNGLSERQTAALLPFGSLMDPNLLNSILTCADVSSQSLNTIWDLEEEKDMCPTADLLQTWAATECGLAVEWGFSLAASFILIEHKQVFLPVAKKLTEAKKKQFSENEKNQSRKVWEETHLMNFSGGLNEGSPWALPVLKPDGGFIIEAHAEKDRNSPNPDNIRIHPSSRGSRIPINMNIHRRIPLQRFMNLQYSPDLTAENMFEEKNRETLSKVADFRLKLITEGNPDGLFKINQIGLGGYNKPDISSGLNAILGSLLGNRRREQTIPGGSNARERIRRVLERRQKEEAARAAAEAEALERLGIPLCAPPAPSLPPIVAETTVQTKVETAESGSGRGHTTPSTDKTQTEEGLKKGKRRVLHLTRTCPAYRRSGSHAMENGRGRGARHLSPYGPGPDNGDTASSSRSPVREGIQSAQRRVEFSEIQQTTEGLVQSSSGKTAPSKTQALPPIEKPIEESRVQTTSADTLHLADALETPSKKPVLIVMREDAGQTVDVDVEKVDAYESGRENRGGLPSSSFPQAIREDNFYHRCATPGGPRSEEAVYQEQTEPASEDPLSYQIGQMVNRRANSERFASLFRRVNELSERAPEKSTELEEERKTREEVRERPREGPVIGVIEEEQIITRHEQPTAMALSLAESLLEDGEVEEGEETVVVSGTVFGEADHYSCYSQAPEEDIVTEKSTPVISPIEAALDRGRYRSFSEWLRTVSLFESSVWMINSIFSTVSSAIEAAVSTGALVLSIGVVSIRTTGELARTWFR